MTGEMPGGQPPTTDWADLWRSLVRMRSPVAGTPEPEPSDAWAERAREFDAYSRRRWQSMGTLRDGIRPRLLPTDRVLDIGAGTGAWTTWFAREAARVTALDTSPAMLDRLHRNIAGEGIDNVEVVRGRWPETAVEPHDIAFCAHAMYGAEDLPAFVAAMNAVSRRECFFVIRHPASDSLMAEAATLVGRCHFTPSFQVACNVLLDMGLHPDVRMEERSPGRERTSKSPETALSEVKLRLDLGPEPTRFDQHLREILDRRLVRRDGLVAWVERSRSVLVRWSPRDEAPAAD